MIRLPVLFMAFLFVQASTPDYAEHYGPDYHDALDRLSSHQPYVTQQFGQGETARQLSAVVFPELIRYSAFKDFFETSALVAIYTRTGQVDFSIGPLQMKPSFVEQLEAAVCQTPALQAHVGIAAYSGTTQVQVRQQRVARLQQPQWQWRYLAAFYAIMQHRFGHYLAGCDPTTSVTFLATAYNYGFSHSLASILQHSTDRYFPYGTGRPGQHSYADVARYYYREHACAYFYS